MRPRTFIILMAFHMLLLLQFSEERSRNSSMIYKAAVVEYSAPLGISLDTKELHYRQNAETFAQITKRAADLDCDIIVFPEHGLLSMDLPKLEDGSPALAVRIPSPEEKINPCVDDKDGLYKDLKELSCAARDNHIYVVVNVAELERCSSSPCAAYNTTTDRLCPKNEAFYYNSNVVFDREGNVVARYRMYGEMPLVPPDNPEYTIIETDFGIRFGMFISFDMSFQEPALKLVTELGVHDILYTSCSFSEMPFQTAVQYQAAWSHAMDVNFLSAGYNYPEYGTGGSGIFAGRMGTLVAVMPEVRSSYLLVATVVKKHALCYDQFFKILPNGLVIPLPGKTGEKEAPPYEYDRNYPIRLHDEVQSGQESRESAAKEENLEERVELDIAEKCREEREEEEEEQDSQPARGNGGDSQQEEQDDTQPRISEEEPVSKKKCPCCLKKLPSDSDPEKSRGPPEEQDYSEPPLKSGGKKKCDVRNLNVKLEENSPDETREPLEEQEEPPAKVDRKKKCGIKLEENSPDETREPPEEQEEPPAKVGRKKKCGIKPEENGRDESREPAEEQEEPPAKVGRKEKCGIKLEENSPDETREPLEEQEEPPAKVCAKKTCCMKNLNVEFEDNGPDETREPPLEDYDSHPTVRDGGEEKYCGRKLSLATNFQDISEEGEGDEDGRQPSDDDSKPFTDDESEFEEELPVKGKDEVYEYPEEGGGDKCQQGSEAVGEYNDNAVPRVCSDENVITNVPNPCTEESLFKRYTKKWLPPHELPHDEPGSGLHVQREGLENYVTFRLTPDRMKENSSVRLCHGTFCCDFDVVMCSGKGCYGNTGSTTDGPRYNYRLVAFDGLRNMDQGRYQVCAVISCTDDSLQSCGQFIKDPNVNVNHTRFYKLLISGVFKRENSIIGANTVAHKLLPLPVSKFQFFSENIADDEQAVKMESIVPELSFLTFGIYGRNYDVNDFGINKLVCEV